MIAALASEPQQRQQPLPKQPESDVVRTKQAMKIASRMVYSSGSLSRT